MPACPQGPSAHARIDAILTGYTRHRTLPAHISHWAATAGLQIAAAARLICSAVAC